MFAVEPSSLFFLHKMDMFLLVGWTVSLVNLTLGLVATQNLSRLVYSMALDDNSDHEDDVIRLLNGSNVSHLLHV